MPRTELSEKLASAKSDLWGTPTHIYRALAKEFDFRLDLAAHRRNRKCTAYLGPDHVNPEQRDALAIGWARLLTAFGRGSWAFVNPPFSRIDDFMSKIWIERQEGAQIVAFLPMKTETVWFHELAHRADEIRILRRRVAYIDDATGQPADGAFFASGAFIFNGRAPVFTPSNPRVVWWDIGTAKNPTKPRLMREGEEVIA